MNRRDFFIKLFAAFVVFGAFKKGVKSKSYIPKAKDPCSDCGDCTARFCTFNTNENLKKN